MSEPKRFFVMSEVAAQVGNYEERAMFPDDVDPQFHVSRNEVPQPFHLICDHDTVLVQVSGSARVHFARGAVRHQDLVTGDFLYVPAGTPHRIVPVTPSVHYRIKAAHPEREAAAWYCSRCSSELHYDGWDAMNTATHEAYRAAAEAFNAEEAKRTCGECGALAEPADISQMAWK